MGCRLIKSLYGLKQSAHNWFDTLGTFLISKGFRRSKTDPCLYVFRDHQGVVFIFVYMEDMLIAATTADLVERTKRHISSKWSITDLGPVSHYLSVLARFLTNLDERHQAGLQQVNDYLAYSSDYAITY
jgi:hypothetical protein